MIIQTSQDTIEIDFPKGVKIGVKVSGGADSAIMAYMMAKYKLEYDPTCQLIPVTFISEQKPYQKIFADKVIAKIAELTGVKWDDRFVKTVRSTNPEYITDQMEGTDYARRHHIVHFVCTGITKNPPKEVYDQWLPLTGPVDDRDVIDGKRDPWFKGLNYMPLVNTDKQGVRELYEHFDVLDELFPLTRSCEELTTDFSKHCGECWFCKEREWGFGKL